MSSSMSYDPDPEAVPAGQLYTALLSQRDLSLQVPINFVTVPGISLRAACFAENRFEGAAARKCFSNLLAAGFRRFEIDLYWDAGRLLWSLCPAELGGASSAAASPAPVTSPAVSITSAVLSSGGLLARRETPSTTAVPAGTGEEHALRRQDSDTAAAGTTSLAVLTSSTVASETDFSIVTATASSAGTISSSASPSGDYPAGPYTCSNDTNLDLITDILASNFDATATNLNATLMHVSFNIHAAAQASNPGGSPQALKESQLPQDRDTLGRTLNASLSSYLYTPPELESQRQELNNSWYAAPSRYQPDPAYYQTNVRPDGTRYTPDGWPGEGFIELRQEKRLLVGFGTVDAQMAGYNTSVDSSTLFPAGYLSRSRPVTTSPSGEVTDGCPFNAGQTSLAAVNSSWLSTDYTPAAGLATTASVNNITSCGISPFLNSTVANATADANITAYRSFVQGTIWSWQAGEPRDQNSTDTTAAHCAVLNMSSHGQWQVADCTSKHYGACRASGSPYAWRVSQMSGSYDRIADTCPSGSSFSAPRTALENTYLRSSIDDWTSGDPDNSGNELFWVDFNDLDVEGCWVSGVNQTCPYRATSDATSRTVVVPTVAAVIVFVIAALTVFVKCASNRRSSKSRRRRRRRGDDGWEYEGVPS